MNRYFKIFVLIITSVLFLFSGCKDKDVTGVRIIPDAYALRVGETKELIADISPDNADDKSVRWNIINLWAIDSARDVASITEYGKVTGLAEGCASVACVTNNSFCEATATIYVGYAVAVTGAYTGSLSKNEVVLNTAAKTGIEYVSEYGANFGLSIQNFGFSLLCPITVEYKSDKMQFDGETTVDLDGTTTPVKVSGVVKLDGLADFEILVGDDTYTFFGTKDPRNQSF